MLKKYICIAGKNECAVEIVKFLLKKKMKKNLLILLNKKDNSQDEWQPSLKKFAKKNKLKIVNEKMIQNIENLILFSIEYEKILKIKNFKSENLFNVHFSLLPKYQGCHSNYLQIKFGEKYSGVTLHLMDSGIDTGKIIDQIKFPININDTAIMNYKKLMKYAVKIFKKNFRKIINNKFNLKIQNIKKSSYYSREYVDYKKEKFINFDKSSKKIHNMIRALIFPPFQLPVVNNKTVYKSINHNNKIYLKYR